MAQTPRISKPNPVPIPQTTTQTMPEYLLVQRGNPDSCQPSPSQMEATFAHFNTWRSKFESQIVNLGGRLGDGAVVRHEGVTDGPHIEAKEIIGGYMIVSAANLDEATQIAAECPGVSDQGSYVEVREIMLGGCAADQA